MSYGFEAILHSADRGSFAEISALSPHSPFNTLEYASALHARGAEPYGMALIRGGRIAGGFVAAITGKKWNRTLKIYSVQHLAAPEVFWTGVSRFCADQNVCGVDVQTFASVDPSMPDFDTRLSSRQRSEFIIDLTSENFRDHYGRSHKQRLKKAAKAGFNITRSREFSDYEVHVRMMQASVTRRRDRGESVPTATVRDFDYALLDTGLGELIQASLDGQVLSSMLLLRAAASGYYHSSGTSQEGMHLDASRYLISEVAGILAVEGRRTFNLGGVDPGAEGLRSYKSGFGAAEVELKAEAFSTISPLARTLRNTLRTVARAPHHLLGLIRR